MKFKFLNSNLANCLNERYCQQHLSPTTKDAIRLLSQVFGHRRGSGGGYHQDDCQDELEAILVEKRLPKHKRFYNDYGNRFEV
jgi:hypothetical protein